MSCNLCESPDNDELYSLESTFTYQNRVISFYELVERQKFNDGSKVCQICLLKLKAKFIFREERTWSEFEPYIVDDGISIENPSSLCSDAACCENCFTTDKTSGLYEVGTTSFCFDGEKVTFVDCFKFCIGLPPEDEQRPVMCRKCMRAMMTDYLKKHHTTSIPRVLQPKSTLEPLHFEDSTAGMQLIKIKTHSEESQSETEDEEELSEPLVTPKVLKEELDRNEQRSTTEEQKRSKSYRKKRKVIHKRTLKAFGAKEQTPINTDDEYADSDVEKNAEPLVAVKEEPIEVTSPETSSAFNEIAVKIEPELMIGDQVSQMSCEDDSQTELYDPEDEDDPYRHEVFNPDPSTSAKDPRTNGRMRYDNFTDYFLDQNSKNRFECKYCPVYVNTKSSLSRHVLQRHIEQIDKPFTIYTDHILTRKVDDTIIYICTICRIQKPSYREYKIHVYFEHYEDPNWPLFRCDVCEDGVFDVGFMLAKHKRQQHDARRSNPLLFQGKPIERI